MKKLNIFLIILSLIMAPMMNSAFAVGKDCKKEPYSVCKKGWHCADDGKCVPYQK